MTNTIEEVYSVKIEKDPDSGAVISQTWFNSKGLEDNPVGPARVEYDLPTGEPQRIEWMKDGEAHRDEREGPAIVRYDPSDGEASEEYCWEGHLHRLAGPAVVRFNKHSGDVRSTQYVRHGVACNSTQLKGLDPSP